MQNWDILKQLDTYIWVQLQRARAMLCSVDWKKGLNLLHPAHQQELSIQYICYTFSLSAFTAVVCMVGGQYVNGGHWAVGTHYLGQPDWSPGLVGYGGHYQYW